MWRKAKCGAKPIDTESRTDKATTFVGILLEPGPFSFSFRYLVQFGTNCQTLVEPCRLPRRAGTLLNT